MAQAEIKAVITAKDEASSVVSGFGKSIGNLALPMGVVGAAIIGFGALAVASFNASEKEASQLGAVLKSTGGIAGVTAEMANNLASSLQKVTRFSDEAVLGGENLLLTFTNIGKDIFPQATEVMLDMSQALGQDVKSSAIQLGKALQDPILGVTALRRVGVNFNEAQQEVIKNLVETGRAGEAQALILKELKTEFGGSARAAGQTFAGQLDILKNSLDDVMESIGGVIANAISPLVEKVKPVVDGIKSWIEQNPKLATGIVGVVAGIGLLSLAFAGLAIVLGIVDTVGAPFIAIAVAVLAIGGAIGFLVEKTIGWQNVWNGLVSVYNTYIKPALMDLWNTIQTQLLPVLQEFWDKNQNWIIPALQALGLILGGIVLGAILGVIYAIKGIVIVITEVISFLGNLQTWFTTAFQFIADKATYLKDHFWEVVGQIVGFFATLPFKIPMYIGLAIAAALNFLAHVDWGAVFNRIVEVSHQVWDRVNHIVVDTFNYLRNLDWGGILTNISKGLANGITGFIEGAINGALSGIPGAPKIHIPRFAGGVQNFSGGLAMVGERGPELVNLPRGSDVIPNGQISSGSNTTININVGLMTGSAVERRDAAAKMFEDLKDIASSRGQTVSQMIGSA